MRTHNPLHDPAPWMYTTAARFCFLIRRDGTRAVPTGERNARVTQYATPQVLGRLDAAAHVLRVDYEVQSISVHDQEPYIYLTITPRKEN